MKKLREAIQRDNQAIVMKPGRYALTDLPENSRNLPVSGSKNSIDLSGVYVAVQVGSTPGEYITISGNDNIFDGGTFEDIYKSGLEEVTGFSAYNKDRRELARGLGGDAVLSITGNDNKVANTKLTIRGSFPYGYGSIYGIGADNAFGLNKRCGLLVRGIRNIVDGCEIQQRAFGHGIYIQKPADKTVVKNCLVEGRMRPSKDLYLESDPDDLPVRSNYKMQSKRNQNDGAPIPKDIMIPLSEDGIRVYTHGGSVTVENCTVKRMRGGIAGNGHSIVFQRPPGPTDTNLRQYAECRVSPSSTRPTRWRSPKSVEKGGDVLPRRRFLKHESHYVPKLCRNAAKSLRLIKLLPSESNPSR